MAPRRGGSDDDDGGGGLQLEETVTLYMVDEYRNVYRIVVYISGILILWFLGLFIWSIINRQMWFKVSGSETRYLTMMIAYLLFMTIAWGLTFADYLATFLEATVFESWYLITAFTYTFFFIAEFLLVAVFYYILHNRLRALGIKKTVVTKLAIFHCLFAVMVGIHLLVKVAGDWIIYITWVLELKTGKSYYDLLTSEFIATHYRRIYNAYVVQRTVLQLEIIAVGLTVLVKSRADSGGKKAMSLFFWGSLVIYLANCLVILIVNFQYLKKDPPSWVLPFQFTVEGLSAAICATCICLFARCISREQWALGKKSRHQPPPNQDIYSPSGDSDSYTKPSSDETYQIYQPPPPNYPTSHEHTQQDYSNQPQQNFYPQETYSTAPLLTTGYYNGPVLQKGLVTYK